MGITNLPQPAKLIAGLLVSNPDKFMDQVNKRLVELFGPIEKITKRIPFDKSNYYEKEMGTSLFRYFLSFEALVPPDKLPGIKLKTNEIESELLNEHGGRSVNIDPGILTLQNLVLATTKNYTHRIYLGKGIYADLTLIFQKGAYRPLPWTYPDYREEATRTFFSEVREIYKEQLKGLHP
jgi:hypothetical protein